MAVTFSLSVDRSLVKDDLAVTVSVVLVNTGAALTISQVGSTISPVVTKATSIQDLVDADVPNGTTTLSYIDTYGSAGLFLGPDGGTAAIFDVAPWIRFSDNTVVLSSNTPQVEVVPVFSQGLSPFGNGSQLPGPGQYCLDFNENSYLLATV